MATPKGGTVTKWHERSPRKLVTSAGKALGNISNPNPNRWNVGGSRGLKQCYIVLSYPLILLRTAVVTGFNIETYQTEAHPFSPYESCGCQYQNKDEEKPMYP